MAAFMGKPGASSAMAAALLLTVLISLSSQLGLVVGESCNFYIKGSRGAVPTVTLPGNSDTCVAGPIVHYVGGVEKATKYVNSERCAFGNCTDGPWNCDDCQKCNQNLYTYMDQVCRRNPHDPIYGECVKINITQVTYQDNTVWHGLDCIIIRIKTK
ncbi:hypothetical protein CBR_g6456 [Chara braunii]|uniref:Gnk2-homologous domain-containing protein n=1 Tax=Chara braunii TaxID=69332 RepID=A0A388KK10_CHABU|nr:hypothetical protein CBR_g6456 [Chara braunii]|eukprot:GBG70328.1 hypothetical protein CBR_g6456 [Chara braunii]